MNLVDKLRQINSTDLKKLVVTAALLLGGTVGCAGGNVVEIVKEEMIPTPVPTVEGAIPYVTLIAEEPTPVPHAFVPPTLTPGPCPRIVKEPEMEIGGVHLEEIDTGYLFGSEPTIPLSSTIGIRGYTVAENREFCVFLMHTDCDSAQLKAFVELGVLQSVENCTYNSDLAISPEHFPDMLYGDKFHFLAGPCRIPGFDEVEKYRLGLSDPDQASIWGIRQLRLCSPGFFNEQGECYQLPCDNPGNIPQKGDIDAFPNPFSQ